MLTMQHVISSQVLANLKLQQWQNSMNFNQFGKDSYEKLVNKIDRNHLFVDSMRKDISVPLLLSMIVELKNEIEEMQDEFELSRIHDFKGA